MVENSCGDGKVGAGRGGEQVDPPRVPPTNPHPESLHPTHTPKYLLLPGILVSLLLFLKAWFFEIKTKAQPLKFVQMNVANLVWSGTTVGPHSITRPAADPNGDGHGQWITTTTTE